MSRFKETTTRHIEDTQGLATVGSYDYPKIWKDRERSRITRGKPWALKAMEEPGVKKRCSQSFTRQGGVCALTSLTRPTAQSSAKASHWPNPQSLSEEVSLPECRAGLRVWRANWIGADLGGNNKAYHQYFDFRCLWGIHVEMPNRLHVTEFWSSAESSRIQTDLWESCCSWMATKPV